MNKDTNKNPLLENFDLAPFSKIKIEHYIPAIEHLIEQTKQEVNAIIENPDEPTFENTIEALEYKGERLDRVTSILFNLNSAETSKEIQKITKEVSPMLSELSNDIVLNNDLFKRIEAVYEKREELKLTPEQQTLLRKKYKGYSRNGACLSDEKKKQKRVLAKELSTLGLQFSENVLNDTNAFELHLIDEKDLKGLPIGIKQAAASLAKEKMKEGWIFTLARTSYFPLMKYAENRELRKKMLLAYGRRSFKNNANNNEQIVLQIAKLRAEKAALLGYKNHAHYILEERMAKTPKKVMDFLNNLLSRTKPFASTELKQIEALAQETDGIERIEKWDMAYYSEKLKNKLYNLDDEILKPYFMLENVINGAFEVADKLYGLRFKKVESIDTYHPDVKTYEVYDKKSCFLAVLYADFHPREGKKDGAWKTTYKSQWKKDGIDNRPHISIVCNFTRPTENEPSLLTFREVQTLFHEFGHALHGILSESTYPSLSGTSVYRDFVELPSQLLENWCYDKECLDLFALHYQTNEKIPLKYIEKIRESANFLEGIAMVRQLSFGLLDMYWHGFDISDVNSVNEYEKIAVKETELMPINNETCSSVAFSHIFSGGYSSGYYSYKWAEVLEADAFELFKEKGIFNREVAESFANNILKRGGTEHPMTLYKRFRGKEPDSEALFERAGLV